MILKSPSDLKKHIKKLGMKFNSEYADYMGIPRQTMGRWLNGKTPVPEWFEIHAHYRLGKLKK